MAKDTKLVHLTVIDGTQEEIQGLLQALSGLREKANLPYEFLVTNEKIQLRDVKYLIKELYELYNKEKKIKETQLKELKKIEEDKKSDSGKGPLIEDE